MIAGSEKESRSLMMEAAIRSVARYGFEGFTTKKWALETGVAEGSLYYHFKSKDELLNETFFYIEKEIVELYKSSFREVPSSDDIKKLGYVILERYYQYLIENPDKTLYYYRFRTSPRFNSEVQEQQVEYYGDFLAGLERYIKGSGIGDQVDWQIIWSYVLDSTASLAYRIITGGAPDAEKNGRQVTRLVMGGLKSIAGGEEQ